MTNFNDKKVKEHLVLLFIDRNTAAYFNFFRTEYISQEVLNKIRDKSITHNILYYVWILLYFTSLVCVV